MSEASIIRWLLEGDPAIRWQVERDLTHEPDDVVVAERSRIGCEGWGRALLDRQASEGWWVRPDDEGWMATTDALVLLCAMGLDPSGDEALRAVARVKKKLTFETLGKRPYFDGETEPCINGAILAVGSFFGERCDLIVDRLLDEQLADGGWNCEAPPSTRSRSIRPSASSRAYCNTNSGGASRRPLRTRGTKRTTICWSGGCSGDRAPAKS